MRRLGWNKPDVPLSKLQPEAHHLCTVLWMAHEVGDSATEDRIRDFAASEYQPRFLGDDNDRFAFWFGYDSTWPRGQLNATVMLAESGSPGAWWRVFNEPNLAPASEPALRGVDYPNVGIRRAQNDMAQGLLTVETTAGTPSRRGEPTSFTVHQIPSPAAASVSVDGQDSAGWEVTGGDSIRLDLNIGDHQIRVAFPGGGSPQGSPRR
jgi:hypothetical protein